MRNCPPGLRYSDALGHAPRNLEWQPPALISAVEAEMVIHGSRNFFAGDLIADQEHACSGDGPRRNSKKYWMPTGDLAREMLPERYQSSALDSLRRGSERQYSKAIGVFTFR